MTPNPSENALDSSEPVAGKRPCAQCAEPVLPVDRHPEQRHCSRACQLAAYRRNTGHVPAGTPSSAVCARCGIRFGFIYRGGRRKLCDECR